MRNDDLAEDALIEIEEQRVNLILQFGTLKGKVMHVDAEGAVCLLIEVSRLRAENARLRAQVAEYFHEPATHPVEEP